MTDPTSADARLRGRTYTITFDRVWWAATWLAQGGLRGWRVTDMDDRKGVINVITTTFPFGWEADVQIKIGLDENGQTRVDVRCRSRGERPRPSRDRKTIARFVTGLDRRLRAEPAQILDPTRPPAWLQDAR